MGYDMIPWKLVFCTVAPGEICMEDGPKLKLTKLPPPPEPGRVPQSCDHVHIRPKLSSDQRNARDDYRWRALLLATARCQHGRTQEDDCVSCPDRWAPDQSGKRIGTTYDGRAVVIPKRGHMHEYNAWTP